MQPANGFIIACLDAAEHVDVRFVSQASDNTTRRSSLRNQTFKRAGVFIDGDFRKCN